MASPVSHQYAAYYCKLSGWLIGLGINIALSKFRKLHLLSSLSNDFRCNFSPYYSQYFSTLHRALSCLCGVMAFHAERWCSALSGAAGALLSTPALALS